MSRTFALIPAAGKSTRMGRPKLTLPVGARTVLECVIDGLRGAGVDRVLVVTAPKAGDVAAVARSAGTSVLSLEHDTPDMRATVERGLDWIATHWKPTAEDGWLLLPADHPTVDAKVVQALLDARGSRKSVLVPTYQARRGHPTWVSWKQVSAIRAFPREQGLNLFFRTLAQETSEVPVQSPTVLLDLDTPEDYERLLAHFKTT